MIKKLFVELFFFTYVLKCRYEFITGYWSLVRRVTGPTVVVADIGTVSKGRTGTPCISSVLVRNFGVSLNLQAFCQKIHIAYTQSHSPLHVLLT